MSSSKASSIFRIAAIVLVVAAAACFILGRRLRSQEQGVVGEAEKTIFRETLRDEAGEQ